jgi:hypothetical protein
MSLSTSCILINYQEYENGFEDFQPIKFTVSFNANPFHKQDIREYAAIISPVFKENFSELKPEIIKFQNRLITENCRDQQRLGMQCHLHSILF